MAQYRTGTVSVTNGSAAIVGTDTLWAAEIAAGDLFVVVDDGVDYTVATVTDDTHIALSSVYAGTTDAAAVYAISTGFTPVQGYPYPEKGDIETAVIIKRALTMIDSKTTLISTSTTSLLIGAGSKTLTVETGKMFQPGQFISIVDQANNANYMSGQVTAYTSSTGSLTVDVAATGGSGTIAAWYISLSGTGDVVGPASSVDNQLALFSGVTGKLIKASEIKTVNGATILGAGNIAAYNPNSLTHIYHPTLDGGFRDKYRAGWLPSWFNQQWGGAQWGGLPDGSFGSVATGNVQDNATHPFGDQSLYTSIACGTIISETMTPPGVWLKLYKVGNPTDNVTLQFGASSGGLPISGLGVLTSVPGKQITSRTDGEWYFFSGSAPALTANTQYHLLLARSGAVDASNYYVVKITTARKYPYGLGVQFFDGSIWQASSTYYCFCFLIENPAANSLIQPGGVFGNYKLAFNPGNPVNQSRSLAQPLSQFYDGKECSVIHRGTYAVSSNVWDFAYGLDHDRITVTVNASGYPVLSIYEADRTLHQVTGASAITTGNHDVAIKVRTVGDGADYAYLYVDGVSVGTPLTAQTFTMSNEMRELGTARLGDGFGIIPAWTQDMQMTSLPSAQGWTYAGTTEASCQSIQGGKLYTNANGAGSTQSQYSKTVSFVNATGEEAEWKGQIITGNAGFTLQLEDAGKKVVVVLNEYYLTSNGTGSTDFTYQMDLKSKENVIGIKIKGSDYYIFANGELIIEGTGKATTTTANNTFTFGNLTAVACADVITSYIKYYQGGMILPIATTGTCSEFAHWSGDKSDLFAPLWNAGSPVSVKQLCGVEKNYIGEGVVQKEVRRGVTPGPTSDSGSTSVLIPEMEAYVIGSEISATHQTTLLSSQAAGNVVGLSSWLDGANGSFAIDYTALTNTGGPLLLPHEVSSSIGLHKIESRMNQGGSGTLTSSSVRRILKVEAKS